jgi:hypothetical protein
MCLQSAMKAIKDMHRHVEDNFRIVDRQARSYIDRHGQDVVMKE